MQLRTLCNLEKSCLLQIRSLELLFKLKLSLNSKYVSAYCEDCTIKNEP